MRNQSQFSCWDVHRVSEAAIKAPSYVNVLLRLPARKPRHVVTGLLPLWAISHPKRVCLLSNFGKQ
jgi:hypothetical protein